jgi:hypothetical protein
MPRVNLIQVRRGTESEWTTADPTLAAGEIGFISDTNEIVIGDGSTAFTGLTPIGGGGGGSGLSDNYDDIDELIADQANQELNGLYYVGDASDDPTVDSGWAVYRYLGTTDGDLDDYQKLSEEESLDVVFNVLGAALTGYSPAAGTISATDTILQAFNKVGNFISNIATTIRGTVLTGYTAGSNAAIAATDTILQAFGKTQGQLNAKLNTGNNTGLAGTGLKFVYANADGQIVRNGNVSYNTTTGEMRIDGLSSIADDFSLSIYNDANEMIMRVSNGKYVEYGGTSSFWEVQSDISDGNAGIITLPGFDIGYRIKDTSSFDYAICKSSTSGIGRAFIIKQTQVNDHGAGFQTVRKQYRAASSTTNNGQNIVASIPVPSGYVASVHVAHAFAKATNGNVQECNPFKILAKNDAGTLSGVTETITTIQLGAASGGFNVNYNDTTDEVEVRFQNEATGRSYEIDVDLTYILTPIPS